MRMYAVMLQYPTGIIYYVRHAEASQTDVLTIYNLIEDDVRLQYSINDSWVLYVLLI